MTIDFRPPEEREPAPPFQAKASPAGLPARTVVLAALLAGAGLFIALGLTLLVLVHPAFLGPQQSVFVGVALLVTGIADLVAALVLRRLWRAARH